jgi:hypothetical protein
MQFAIVLGEVLPAVGSLIVEYPVVPVPAEPLYLSTPVILPVPKLAESFAIFARSWRSVCFVLLPAEENSRFVTAMIG